MILPNFAPGDDPGPDFAALARKLGLLGSMSVAGDTLIDVPHGTTCVAARFVDGVIMAGDRRATSGHLISHRSIEKVFPADRHSGVAIAGAAGPAIEMVRLFQLQLEHYEKVEGAALSLEGKANQLGQLVAAHLPMAMQGLAVVPIFAGYDRKRRIGRLFQYDVTGGRYEEREFTSTGSGSLHASTVIKLGWDPDLTQERAIALLIASLYEAADEDSATGGPDLVRGIFPIVAVIDARGFRRVPDQELRPLVEALVAQRTQAATFATERMTAIGEARQAAPARPSNGGPR
jgi:proteasome beta subunit